MRVKRLIVWMLCISLSVLCLGCGNTEAVIDDTDTTEAVFYDKNDTEMTTSKETNTEAEIVISESDLIKQQMKYETSKKYYEQEYEWAMHMQTLSNPTMEQVEEVVQSRILSCYQENTLYAVEIKSLVVESLGYSIPGGFQMGDDVVDQTVDEIVGSYKEAFESGALSLIGSEETQEVLRSGIDGALSSYQNGGNLEDILNSASESVINGVVAKIQDAPYEYAIKILDETTGGLASVSVGLLSADSVEDYLKNLGNEKTGGLIDSVSGIVNYDKTPNALFQSVSDSTNSSSAKIKEFLSLDHVTSDDISILLYNYSQFGNSLDLLGVSGGETSLEWTAYYDQMEALYQQYVSNEMMIELLGNGPYSQELSIEFFGEDDYGSDFVFPVVEEDEELSGTIEEQYNQRAQKIEEYEAAAAILEEYVDNRRAGFSLIHECYAQVEHLRSDCHWLLQYEVENFAVQYDSTGSTWIQDNNQIYYAVGSLAKYVPGAAWVTLFTAGAISTSDKYYENMVSTNDEISVACAECVSDARSSLERLYQVLYFLDDLTSYSSSEEGWENQQLLWYLYGDETVNIDSYITDAYQKLYLLGCQMHVVYQLYSTIYKDSSGALAYETQYNNIMAIMRDDVKDSISKEDMATYLIPIMNAAKTAISNSEQTTVAQLSGYRTGFFYLYKRQTGASQGYKVHYLYIAGLAHLSGYMDIYYFNGDPFYVNGAYLYDDIVINGSDDSDGTVIKEEAVWMGELPNSTSAQDDYKEHAKRMSEAFGTLTDM